MFIFFFFFQAEDGIRDLVRSRGLGDVYKRQTYTYRLQQVDFDGGNFYSWPVSVRLSRDNIIKTGCLLYTSDAADERSSVDLGGRRIIKKKNNIKVEWIHRVVTINCTVYCRVQ